MGTGPPPATFPLPNPPSLRSSPSSMTRLSQVESQPPQAPRIEWVCTLRQGLAGVTWANSILREASRAKEKGSRQVNLLGQVLRSHTDPILWPKRDWGCWHFLLGEQDLWAGQEPADSKEDPLGETTLVDPTPARAPCPQVARRARRQCGQGSMTQDRQAKGPGSTGPSPGLLCGLVSCC